MDAKELSKRTIIPVKDKGVLLAVGTLITIIAAGLLYAVLGAYNLRKDKVRSDGEIAAISRIIAERVLHEREPKEVKSVRLQKSVGEAINACLESDKCIRPLRNAINPSESELLAMVSQVVRQYCSRRDNCRGSRGSPGSDGRRGPAGRPSRSKGPRGRRGPQGIQGSQGPAGPPGPSIQISPDYLQSLLCLPPLKLIPRCKP